MTLDPQTCNDVYGLIGPDGEHWSAEDIRGLRAQVIKIRNEALGPKVFDPNTAVILSHTISVMATLAKEMDAYTKKRNAA